MLKIDIIYSEGKRTCYHSPSLSAKQQMLITEENEAVWGEYIRHKIEGLITSETMESPDFRAAEEKVRKEEERRLRHGLKEKKNREDYYRRKVMERPKIAFIPKGLSVDYEKEYAKFFNQEVTYEPLDSDDFLYQFRLLNRWQEKSVPQILELGRPDAAYAVAIELCRHIPLFLNRDDLQDYIKTYKVRIKKFIVASYSALVTAVKAWNNEEKRRYVSIFIFEQSKQYGEFRGLQKTLIQMMPSDAFAGEPLHVVREMNDEEAYQVRQEQRRKEFEERVRLAEEREAKSLIPLNQDYESRIFNSRNIGWDCDIIAHLMYDENKHIKALAEGGQYQEAALKFLQLTKSMCRHFISDEHYNYFDDMYSPEYAIDDLVDHFNRLFNQGKLPEDVKNYLHKRWAEIQTFEACTDYGLLSRCTLSKLK